MACSTGRRWGNVRVGGGGGGGVGEGGNVSILSSVSALLVTFEPSV